MRKHPAESAESEEGSDHTSAESDHSEDSDPEEEVRHHETARLKRKSINKHSDEMDPIYQQYQREGYDEKEALQGAIAQLRPKLRKTFRKQFEKTLIRAQRMKQDSVYKAVMRKAKDIQEDGELNPEDAIREACIKKKRLLNEQFPSDSSSSSDDDSE